MRDLPWLGEFGGAVCFWSSFGYFDEQGNADFLRAVSNALKPGARFLLDTPWLKLAFPRWRPRHEFGGRWETCWPWKTADSITRVAG